MATALKKKTKQSAEDFIPMRRTRALLTETWDLWRESFEQSPKIAKRVLTQGLSELHKAEKEIQKKAKGYVKKPAVKKIKSAVKKAKTKLKHKAKV